MLSDTIFKDILPVIEEQGIEVVELLQEQHSEQVLFKVFIDKDDGITVGDCSRVARLINDEFLKLDTADLHYRLEVSSPGLDRPLKTARDFKRNIARRVQVMLTQDSSTAIIEGKLVSVDEHILVIEKNNKSENIPFEKVVQGKVILPW